MFIDLYLEVNKFLYEYIIYVKIYRFEIYLIQTLKLKS